ncbi:osmotin-like protein [Lolium rigidum]|uniref:osmotin-like protein n=1 Tax=Lolium rigidum TaxID=89674 RepID=UPI001F5DFD4D|nr:osmotin-like protein [Lolium rigidum]
MAAMAGRLALAFLLAAAAVQAASAVNTTLTLHNLCPFTVYPLVTANGGLPSIADNKLQLEANGLAYFPIPPTSWSGRVVARTLCSSPTNCQTGMAPPVTVVQLVVHSAEAGPGADLATYSVSLTDGFNVGAAVSPQFVGGGQCPVLGCPVNLNDGCPADQRVMGNGGVVLACKGDYGYFKKRCPLTRVGGRDVEPVPQSCRAPRELKVVFCPTTI